jgi:hypothetical protein
MRFNAPEYINEFSSTGQFPKIHRNIVDMALNHVKGRKGLDLCCSHGLLGQQLMQRGNYVMCGIDGDIKAVQLARDHKIQMEILPLAIKKTTLELIITFIKAQNCSFVVARRCLPELFGDDMEFGIEFFHQMREIGITEVMLEGRVATKNAVNPLFSLNAEIDLISQDYTPWQQANNVAYLRAIQ